MIPYIINSSVQDALISCFVKTTKFDHPERKIILQTIRDTGFVQALLKVILEESYYLILTIANPEILANSVAVFKRMVLGGIPVLTFRGRLDGTLNISRTTYWFEKSAHTTSICTFIFNVFGYSIQKLLH